MNSGLQREMVRALTFFASFVRFRQAGAGFRLKRPSRLRNAGFVFYSSRVICLDRRLNSHNESIFSKGAG